MALGLGWALPGIGKQTIVEPARAAKPPESISTIMVTIAGLAVAVAGTLIESGSSTSIVLPSHVSCLPTDSPRRSRLH